MLTNALLYAGLLPLVVSACLAVFGEMCDYWAEKRSTAPRPALPDPHGSLPPEEVSAFHLIGQNIRMSGTPARIMLLFVVGTRPPQDGIRGAGGTI